MTELADLDSLIGPKFFEYLAKCCEILGKDKSHGAELILDPSWLFCFDDGLTPEQAVKEYQTIQEQIISGRAQDTAAYLLFVTPSDEPSPADQGDDQ